MTVEGDILYTHMELSLSVEPDSSVPILARTYCPVLGLKLSE